MGGATERLRSPASNSSGRSECKLFVTGVENSLRRQGVFAIQHDFTEALRIWHQKEAQLMRFRANVSVSIEGCTSCHFHSPDSEMEIFFHFHSLSSDDLQQETTSAVNVHHLKKLVKQLKLNNTLKQGGRVLGRMNGCAKQGRHSTAIRFTSCFPPRRTVTDRATGCPGRGKCEVDGTSGVDKNTICRVAMKTPRNNKDLSRMSKV